MIAKRRKVITLVGLTMALASSARGLVLRIAAGVDPAQVCDARAAEFRWFFPGLVMGEAAPDFAASRSQNLAALQSPCAGTRSIIVTDLRLYSWKGGAFSLWDQGPAAQKQAKRLIRDVVRDYNGRSKVFGYLLGDEPGSREFRKLREIKDYMRSLGVTRELVVSVTPWSVGPGETFSTFLDDFLDVFDPGLFAFDYYCHLRDGSERTVPMTLTDALGHVSTKARLRQKSFLFIFAAIGWADHRPPGAAEFNHDVGQALAFGAQGYVVWPYTSVPMLPEWAPQSEALESREGVLQASWSEMRENNLRTLGLGTGGQAGWIVGETPDTTYKWAPVAGPDYRCVLLISSKRSMTQAITVSWPAYEGATPRCTRDGVVWEPRPLVSGSFDIPIGPENYWLCVY